MARDFDSVVSEIATNLRLDITVPAQLAVVQGWLNDTIEDIHGRHDWYWTLGRQVVQTVIDKTAGTVAVSASGTAVTGASTAFAAADVGKFIQFSGSNDWYKILTAPTATSLTIEAGYNGTSALTAATYTIRKTFYSLPSAEKILSAKHAQLKQDLVCLNHKDFDTFLTFGDTTGKASSFCVFGLDSSGVLQFNIYPHADEAYNIEVKYKAMATEDSLSLVPAKWRYVYLDGCYFRGLQYIAIGQPNFDRNLIRLKEVGYMTGISRMIADAEPESDYHPVLQNRDVQNNLRGPHLPAGLSIPLD